MMRCGIAVFEMRCAFVVRCDVPGQFKMGFVRIRGIIPGLMSTEREVRGSMYPEYFYDGLISRVLYNNCERGILLVRGPLAKIKSWPGRILAIEVRYYATVRFCGQAL